MKQLFRHLELHTAPAFIMLVFASIAFIILNSLNIDAYIYIIMPLSILFIFSGILLYYLKRKLLAYIIVSMSIGLLFYLNICSNTIYLPNKIIPTQKAIVGGEVEKLIKKDSLKARYLVSGFIDTKELKKIKNTKIILNVYGEKNIAVGEKIICKCNVRIARKKVLPTDFDERQYAKGMGAMWVGNTNEKNIVVTAKPSPIIALRTKTFNVIYERINECFSPITASLVSAILLADKSNLSSEIRVSFSLAGIAHILALSGLHIGIIAYILYLFLSFLENRPVLKFLLFSIVLISFIFLVNAPESAVRAGFMAILIMGGKTFQRDTNPLNIISIVVILSLLVKPELMNSISFQLSVTSVLGIFLFLPLCQNFFKKQFNASNSIVNSLAVTFAVSIVTSPIVAYYFGVFSIVSPIINLLLVPLFSLGLILSIITLFFSVFSTFLSEIFAGSVEFLFKICVNIIKFVSEFEFSAFVGNEITFPILLLSIATIYLFSSEKKRQLFFRFCVVAVFFIAIMFINNSQVAEPKTEVFAKNNYSLVSIPLQNNKEEYEIFLWICDRKPEQDYYYDRALIEFISDRNVKTIGINGAFASEFVKSIDDVIKDKNIIIRELNFDEQKALERKFLNGKTAPHLIEI